MTNAMRNHRRLSVVRPMAVGAPLMLLLCCVAVGAAELHRQTKHVPPHFVANYGTVEPNDVLLLTVTADHGIKTASATPNQGPEAWLGGVDQECGTARFVASIPDDFRGIHQGSFSGLLCTGTGEGGDAGGNGGDSDSPGTPPAWSGESVAKACPDLSLQVDLDKHPGATFVANEAISDALFGRELPSISEWPSVDKIREIAWAAGEVTFIARGHGANSYDSTLPIKSLILWLRTNASDPGTAGTGVFTVEHWYKLDDECNPYVFADPYVLEILPEFSVELINTERIPGVSRLHLSNFLPTLDGTFHPSVSVSGETSRELGVVDEVEIIQSEEEETTVDFSATIGGRYLAAELGAALTLTNISRSKLIHRMRQQSSYRITDTVRHGIRSSFSWPVEAGVHYALDLVAGKTRYEFKVTEHLDQSPRDGVYDGSNAVAYSEQFVQDPMLTLDLRTVE